MAQVDSPENQELDSEANESTILTNARHGEAIANRLHGYETANIPPNETCICIPPIPTQYYDSDDLDDDFIQQIVDDFDTMSKNDPESGATITVPRMADTFSHDIHSIHSHIDEEEERKRRQAEEEEERLKNPFRPFNLDSYKRLVEREHELKLKKQRAEEDEGRLVDGEIVFEDTDDDDVEKNARLAEGQSLPESMGRYPKELLGVPLEEIDNCIRDKTFVIIAKKFSKLTIFRFSAERSVWLMPPWSALRRFCLAVISNQYFDFLILLSIILNVAFMIINPEPTSQTGVVFNGFEYFFQALYTIEMIIKVIARGFMLHKHSYLRDGWNWLDFGVVIIAYATIIIEETSDGQGDVNLSGLRGLRVLRALKSISVVPGLRTIVNALLKSLKMLAEVMILTLFCIAVFALLALQLYKGVLRQKCVVNLPSVFPMCNGDGGYGTITNGTGTFPVTCYNDLDTFWTAWVSDTANYYEDGGEVQLCGNVTDALTCPDGYTCLSVGENPNWDYTNFDDFGMSMLNTFQLVTLDFWEDTYNKIIDANGPYNILFFMMVVLVGSFYLINLMLAVVAMAYEQEADVEAQLAEEEEAEEAAKAKRQQNTAALFDPKKLKMQLLQKHKEEEEAKRIAAGGEPNPPTDGLAPAEGYVDRNSPVRSPRPVTAKGEFVRTAGQPGQMPNGTTSVQGGNIVVADMETERAHTPSPTKTLGSEVTTSNVRMMSSPIADRTEAEMLVAEEEEDENAFHDDLPPITNKQRRYLIQKYANLWFNKIKPETEQLIDRNCLCCAKSGLPTYHGWVKCQSMVFVVVNDGLFDLFITLSIIANTIVMGTELFDRCSLCMMCPDFVDAPGVTEYGSDVDGCSLCHKTCRDAPIDIYTLNVGMKDSHANAMEISNLVFTVIFTLEAILKLTALSKNYFKVGWNNFDLFIVILSIPDIFIYALNAGDVPGVSDLARIVKIFRLMRIIKLAQSWNAMKNLLAIIFSTMGALANLSAILLVIIIIFSVLGQQLLGENYKKYADLAAHPELADYGGEIPRWNFVDFYHAFLMVFRILCGEWIEPLWDCMRVVTEAGCTMFFLLTLILGNFMVLNLFLALLLNAFSSDNLEESTEQSKMVVRLAQLFSLCCKKKAGSVTPTDKLGSRASLLSQTSRASRRPRTRLDLILDRNGPERPAVAVNGSTTSIRNLIEATDPHMHEKLNGSAVHMNHNGDNTDLKPLSNGHSRSSRSGSVVSILSNGTSVSNGVLKNRGVEMSDKNLKQIEQAFTTNRHEYAHLETSMSGSAPPSRRSSIMKDGDADKKTTFSDLNGDVKKRPGVVEMPKGPDDDEEDDAAKLDADGHIIISDCFCAAVHRHPKYDECCTPHWSSTREVCARIVTHFVFESFILFLIAFSSITLCFEDIYLHEKPLTVEVLNYLNIMFAVFFFIEMVLKQLAMGLVKYFTSFWTILDFLIVAVSLLDIASTYGNFGDISALRIMRILRALRPLRAVSRWQQMKIVVNALIFAMPAIGNVAVVIIVFWLIFAIMGVQTFRGLFYFCMIDDERVAAGPEDNPKQFAWCSNAIMNLTQVQAIYQSGAIFPTDLSFCTNNSFFENKKWPTLCEEMGGVWDNPLIAFDDVGGAYLALFQVATFEGWMEVMESAIDAPIQMFNQAHFEARLYWYIYFLLFIIFGAFFTLNLIIGVIIENFQVLKKKYDGSYLSAFLTDNQRNYYNTLKKLGKKKPQKTIRRPKNKFSAAFFDLAMNTKFEMAITLCILLNMIVMMLDALPPVEVEFSGSMVNGSWVRTFQDQMDSRHLMNIILEWINFAFTMIFVVEAIIKMIGLRLHYFRRAWNVFDFVVVMLSLVGIVIEQGLGGEMFISPTLLRVVRVFRIGRVLRLVKSAKGIRKLIFALLISIPGLFNIFLLLFIFMFIFAVVGTTLFSNVRSYEALGETVNFQTFGRSILLLFRLATSAGWNDVFQPIQEERFCNETHYIDSLGVAQPAATGDCGIAWLAVIYFLAYLFLSFMVIVNMYIAVILENFAQAHEAEEIGITEDDFDMFYVIWEQYDPLATQYIKLEQLSPFLSDLEDPLGVPKPNGMAIVAFNLPIVEGDRIHCLDVLMALVRRVLHTTEEDSANMTQEHKEANEQLKSQIAEKYRQAFPQRQKVKVLSTTMQRKKEDVAAKTLQRAWRNHRMKQNIMRIKELALDSSQRGSLSHRLSQSFSRAGSANSRPSRPGSMKSIDSRHLALPPELRGARGSISTSSNPSPRPPTTKRR